MVSVSKGNIFKNVFLAKQLLMLILFLGPQVMALIARFMGPTWVPSGADRTQVGPMLFPWTLFSGGICSALTTMANGNAISKCLYFIVICHYLTGAWYDQQCSQKTIGDVCGYLLALQIHTQGKTWHTSSQKNGSWKLKTKLPPPLKFCFQKFIMMMSCHGHTFYITGPTATWGFPPKDLVLCNFDIFCCWNEQQAIEQTH